MKVFHSSSSTESTLQISVEVKTDTLPRTERNRMSKWGENDTGDLTYERLDQIRGGFDGRTNGIE